MPVEIYLRREDDQEIAFAHCPASDHGSDINCSSDQAGSCSELGENLAPQEQDWLRETLVNPPTES